MRTRKEWNSIADRHHDSPPVAEMAQTDLLLQGAQNMTSIRFNSNLPPEARSHGRGLAWNSEAWQRFNRHSCA